jgi:hypothetical protein
MCPGGLLRPSIRELIRDQGAYVIATSDSAADGEYKKRVVAMEAAAASEPGHAKAEFEYYDSRRLADWTNQHPGVVAWVRSQLGRPLRGWQPHGKWVDTHGGKPQPFLPDDKHRLADPHDREHTYCLVDGLIHVRQVLGTGGSSVRLTGLSGVGKTRFAQALFEEQAVPEPLSPGLAVYTDTAHSPDPSPLAVLDELLASRRHAILVVDNCGSQLHNQLTARCKASDRVRLLTIEYDIREDLPLETNVFQLEAASPELIEKVIEQQYPRISQVNVRTITQFADGNSRVAIALANTMESNDSLAGLTDRELFDRLFWLGKEVQEELKIAAEACALVYSFDLDDTDGELSQLAALVGEPPLLLYRRVNQLQKRGLVQQRGRWRAVLPHAIANTLATQALDAIPYTTIEQKLVVSQDRLLRSFSRRLGYLHTSDKAVTIVRRWLSAGGILDDIASLSPLLVDVLTNVAPVDPAAVLHAIKRAVHGAQAAQILASSNASRTRLVRLVRSIAYDKALFEDCLHVLVAFARAEPEGNKIDATPPAIVSLFTLYLSGTHASTQQRAAWIKQALTADDVQLQAIGLEALGSALECYHFSSLFSFEFGARVRDYGAHPRESAARTWFETFINMAVEFAQGDGPLAKSTRDVLARSFRSLWTIGGLADVLEAAIAPLLDGGWERGWLAIRQTIRFDGDGLPADLRHRLVNLEARARPQTLVARVKATVLNSYSGGLDFSDGEDASKGYERAEQAARDLGELVAADDAAFRTLLPLVVNNEHGRQWMFGAGLAAKTPSLGDCWDTLINAFEATPDDQRNVQVLRGFLHTTSERDRSVFERILDEAMNRSSLAAWVPVLQLSAPLDDRGCERLLASMDNPALSAWVFQHLGFGRVTQILDDGRIAQLLQRLSIKPDGLGVAIDILHMHIYDNPKPPGPLLIDAARDLIVNAPLAKNNHRFDHELAQVIGQFLAGSEGQTAASQVLAKVRAGLENYTLSRYDLTETLAALFKTQPSLALQALVGDEAEEADAYLRRRSLAGGRRSSALAGVSIEALLKWCGDGPVERWVRVAPLVPAFEPEVEKSGPRWSAYVLTLLQHAPKPIAVAEALVELIEPMSWSGSRAEAIRTRLPLLDALADMLGPEKTLDIERWKSSALQALEREVRREADEYRVRNERFE